ncbi:MAG: hypothetical protein HYV03_04270 [Deltaproteobacteria bacterium]|nr:hypothetical protein [Deltaproteobacteria bacterium]
MDVKGPFPSWWWKKGSYREPWPVGKVELNNDGLPDSLRRGKEGLYSPDISGTESCPERDFCSAWGANDASVSSTEPIVHWNFLAANAHTVYYNTTRTGGYRAGERVVFQEGGQAVEWLITGFEIATQGPCFLGPVRAMLSMADAPPGPSFNPCERIISIDALPPTPLANSHARHLAAYPPSEGSGGGPRYGVP